MTTAFMELRLYSHGIASCEYFIHSLLCFPLMAVPMYINAYLHPKDTPSFGNLSAYWRMEQPLSFQLNVFVNTLSFPSVLDRSWQFRRVISALGKNL
jgi:hypothetical protein